MDTTASGLMAVLAGAEAIEKDVTDFFSDSGAGKGYTDSNAVSQAVALTADGTPLHLV